MYILAISGFIQDQEQREFEQHFQQLLPLRPRECQDFHLTRDIANRSLYHFFSFWDKKEPLKLFLASSEYQRLKGAFKTLGFIQRSFAGEVGGSADFFGQFGGESKEDE